MLLYFNFFFNVSFGNKKNGQWDKVNTKNYRFEPSESFQNYESKNNTASTQSCKFDVEPSFI